MLLFLTHPELPSCTDCQRWMYDNRWRRVERPRGTPVPRPAGAPTPCWSCPKSPDGRPNPTAELTGKAWLAYELYLQIRAGRPMPDDALVRRNCGLIRLVEDLVERQRSDLAGFVAAWCAK